MTARDPTARRASLISSVCIAFGLFLSIDPALAQTPDTLPSPGALKRLSLEQLMDVEVTSVSRRPEKLSTTASAIQIITDEDIRRSGASSIPEALRLAPNLQVAQVSASQWAVSARGFNNTLANKLLVLVDGRTVYTPLYAGVFWDVQNVPLDAVDRIEVVSDALTEDLATYDLDGQHRFQLGRRHEIIWGLGLRLMDDDTRGDTTFAFLPQEKTLQLYSGFVQDEIALSGDRLRLSVGSKFEHNSYTGFEVQPSVRLAWTPAPRHTRMADRGDVPAHVTTSSASRPSCASSTRRWCSAFSPGGPERTREPGERDGGGSGRPPAAPGRRCRGAA